MPQKRALIVIFDMLAGHWEENITVPATGLQPPNVMGYVKTGRLPVFKEFMDEGVFIYSWNKGECNTPYGQKYLASGAYKNIKAEKFIDHWQLSEGLEKETILSAGKKRFPEGKVGSFGSDAWMQTGWWKARDATYGWGSKFSDFLTTQNCLNWMMNNPDWKMTLLYLAQYDKTGNCPVYKEDALYTQDKHHSILYLDKLLWMIKEFLKENAWWDDTYVFIGSDHGCHYGCDAAVAEGRERGVPEEDLINYCSNHQPPYDCRLWNFSKNSPAGKEIDCCRRTTFIISGGALPDDSRKKIIPYGEIIDFAPTIAHLMDISFSAEGKNLL